MVTEPVMTGVGIERRSERPVSLHGKTRRHTGRPGPPIGPDGFVHPSPNRREAAPPAVEPDRARGKSIEAAFAGGTGLESFITQ
jgi:hypothetical protein